MKSLSNVVKHVASNASKKASNLLQYSSDEQLVALVKKGDHLAFNWLVRRHTNSLYRLAVRTVGNSADAEDIVQSVLLKFWQRPHQWHVDKSRLSTWLYTVVLNACRDWQRRQFSASKWLRGASESELQDRKVAEHSEEYRLDKQQQALGRRGALLLAINDLPDRQRDAINLSVFCELSQNQTAQVLGVSVKALESLLVRAKRTLAKNVAIEFDKSDLKFPSIQAEEPINDV